MGGGFVGDQQVLTRALQGASDPHSVRAAAPYPGAFLLPPATYCLIPFHSTVFHSFIRTHESRARICVMLKGTFVGVIEMGAQCAARAVFAMRRPRMMIETTLHGNARPDPRYRPETGLLPTQPCSVCGDVTPVGNHRRAMGHWASCMGGTASAAGT